MASVRNVGEECTVRVSFWTGSGWGTASTIAEPGGTVQGMARRVTVTERAALHDVSGISDIYTRNRRGRMSCTLTIEKLVSNDILFKDTQGLMMTGQPVRVSVLTKTTNPAQVTRIWAGLITDISLNLEDGPQIESLTVECYADGYPI